MNKAVFFDRDGTLNDDTGHYYVHRLPDFVLIPRTIEALQLLSERGYLLILVTNQGGIAKGEYTLSDAEAIYGRLQEMLAPHGVQFAEMYCCPHHNAVGKCLCRKPLPLMVQKAAARFNIDLRRSYFVGDRPVDMQAAAAAGVRGILVPANGGIYEVVKHIAPAPK